MARRDIKGRHGFPIGYIIEDPGYKTAYHMQKGYAGKYVESSDITFDARGVMYTFGDATETLIRNMES